MHKTILNVNLKPYRIAVIMIAAVLFSASAAIAQSTGGLKGQVRNVRGSGIGGAVVTARQNGKDLKSATANAKGEFVLDGLESGRYNLVFEAKGYSSGVLYNVEVKKGKISGLDDRLILSADQGSLVIVKGSIFYREGTSVTGAKVELERINSDGSVKKLGSSMTNISGEFTFRQPEGAAKLRVRATYNGVTGTKEVEVSEPAIYRLSIILDLSRNEK